MQARRRLQRLAILAALLLLLGPALLGASEWGYSGLEVALVSFVRRLAAGRAQAGRRGRLVTGGREHRAGEGPRAYWQ